MKKLVQINVTCNGSTGRIMTQIQKEAEKEKWEAYSFYGRGKPSNNMCYKISNKLEVLWSVFLTRIFDKHGHGCKKATKRMIKKIKEIDPDVIQLHNVHGYYLNLKLLFDYLKNCNKKIIWTLHDCWSFTGHCSYFTYEQCDKWKAKCEKCPQKKLYPASIFLDNSKKTYENKKKMFTNIANLTIVTPSQWLANLVKQSFMMNYEVQVISNGIDLEVFKPINTINIYERYYINPDKKIILGVAAIWDRRKGLDDFIELSKHIDSDYQIVLVGLNEKQIKKLPKNVIGIQRTENVEELANLYTVAYILFNPSKEETFSLVTVEAMACGTPVIAYNNSAVKELINDKNGFILNTNETIQQNMLYILKYLKEIKSLNYNDVQKYSIQNMTNKYLKLY